MCYISRAAISIWLWICWFAATLFLVIVSPLVLFVLAVWLLPDVLPRRGSKPSTSPIPNRQRHPHLRRNGGDVFWEMPDGEIIPLDGLEASLALKEAADIVGGAFCYEKTKISIDKSR